ncbi:MAG: cytochrome c-type biogenesis protein [Pseudomonadota bacterium]
MVMKPAPGMQKNRLIRDVVISWCLMIVALWATPAMAVDPEIVLTDPVLEARAQALTRQLRCPTCVSQSVDSSNVGVSRDLQLLVRDRIVAGETDQEILDYVASRYGDFVLLKPRASGLNRILWLAPLAVFVIALGTLLATRRQKPAVEIAPLSAAEKDALSRLRADQDG